MSARQIAHIIWPNGRPENVELSMHPDGILRDIAEGVLSKVAEHGHIVMSGARTFMLGPGTPDTRLEYVVLCELKGVPPMLWHHHFTYTREPWPSGLENSRQKQSL